MIFLNYISKFSNKLQAFIKEPYLPYFLEKIIIDRFPRLTRLLKYGTTDATSKKHWDGVWKEEGISTWRTYPNLFRKVLEKVESKSRVLDIGCGPGVLLNKLKHELNCEYVGLDISIEAMKLLNKTDVSGVVSILPEIPFKDFSFNTVIATEVLEHLEEPSETLKQMKRIVKPGGFLVCSVPNECLTKEECDEHLHDFNHENFTSLVKDLGNYEITSVDEMGGSKLFTVIQVTQ